MNIAAARPVAPFILILGILLAWSGYAPGQSLPSSLDCQVQPCYRTRPDGKPGREVRVNFTGGLTATDARLEVKGTGFSEVVRIPDPAGLDDYRLLLPPNVGVAGEARVTIRLVSGKSTVSQSVTVKPMRQWTVYIYPHSHVDIGYTNTQKNVEILHKRNIEEGIRLAEATAGYPEGSRYRWNPEVTWPLERYWQEATQEQKAKVITAIRNGWLCLDAAYLNTNTSACSDEELFHLFSFAKEMEQATGVPVRTFQQMDIPGMSWGLVPVMADQGIRYIMSWPNSCRAGYARSLDEKPFWWMGPDGRSKVLFFQPGGYANSGSMSKGGEIRRPWFGQRDPGKVPAVIRTGSANVDFLKALETREKPDYPYDYYVVSWCLWDNTPIDADLPDAVRAWNEQYAYPHLVIAGANEIMQMIEKRYGDRLPVVTGDFSEYWTDGLGTAAGLTALNRNAKEKLIQAEILQTELRPGLPFPDQDFSEAWRFIALGTEHTWCTENPTEPYFQDAIWKVKQSYFRDAADRTQTLLDEALAPATDKSDGALGPEEGPSNGGVTVFNTSSWSHGGLVTLSVAESRKGDRVVDDGGREVPAQRLSTGELAFLAGEVPPFGSAHYRVVPGKCTLAGGCSLGGNTLQNGYLRITVDPLTGNVSEMIRLSDGFNLADPSIAGGLNAFRWMPGDSDDARPDTVTGISVTESGPLLVELKVTSRAAGCRSVTRSVRLIAGQPWVEITNVVDKLPLTAKDGIHFGFPFSIRDADMRVDIPWGVMQVEADQWPAANRNWLTLQRWVDVSNEREGITWCSLDAMLFEAGGLTANQTGTWSGERKPWLRQNAPGSVIWSWVMNNHWFTNFPLTQEGPVTFRYRLLPHGAFDAAVAARFGMEQSQPLVALAAGSNAIAKPLIQLLAPPAVIVSSMKSSSDGQSLIIRLRSVSAVPEKARLQWPAGLPKSIEVLGGELSTISPEQEFTVPAMGMLTLRAAF